MGNERYGSYSPPLTPDQTKSMFFTFSKKICIFSGVFCPFENFCPPLEKKSAEASVLEFEK